MPETPEVADLYAAIEESAGLLDIPCSRGKVLPVLTAYSDALPHAVIAFRVGTGERYSGDLDWRFTVPRDIDPYAVALSNGLTERTDHPVAALLSDVSKRCPVGSYGIDFGVAGGFKKIYAFFPPDDMQSLSTLVDIPSMPSGLAEHFDFFARHGLDGDKVNVFGIDYRHRTANVYFGGLPPEVLEPATVRSMLRELGLPEPSEQMLALGRQAFGIYVTLGWDSAQVERYCFAVMPPSSQELAVPMDPRIEKFLKDVSQGGDDRFIYYAGVSATEQEHYKLQAYFKWNVRMLDQMLLSDSAEDAG